MFAINQRLTIHYPDSTIVQPAALHWTARHITVTGVRDLLAQPLTAREFLRRPLLNRGRYLIHALDAAIGQPRRFYLATTMDEYRTPPLRLGLFQTGHRLPVQILEEFDGTRRDRILAARLVTDLLPYDFGPLTLGLYCDDLTLRI
jgi:hypothetical protein